MFQWIRARVKNAVLAGLADAVEHLQHQAGDCDDAEQLLAERCRLLPGPAPEAEQEGKPRRGKAG